MSIDFERREAPCRPLSVVVLLGGWSAERGISLESGRAVTRALRSRGHDARELDPAEIDLFTYPWAGVDAAFIALHGPFGEDGTVQSLLEEMRVAYTGSGPRASRLAMNKSATKECFLAHGLATPHYQVAHAQESAASSIEKADRIGYPLVVKPNAQGSSIGVSIVQDRGGLAGALAQAFAHDPLAILEAFVPGRELTVGVLDRRPLPVIEVRPARQFFDFEAKYRDDATAYIFDTGLPADLTRTVESLAVSAADVLGCRGVARVDLRLDHDLRPWLLEVNTIPGLTDHSLIPKSAARAGLSFPELCERLVAEVARRPAASENQAA